MELIESDSFDIERMHFMNRHAFKLKLVPSS